MATERLQKQNEKEKRNSGNSKETIGQDADLRLQHTLHNVYLSTMKKLQFGVYYFFFVTKFT